MGGCWGQGVSTRFLPKLNCVQRGLSFSGKVVVVAVAGGDQHDI